MLHRVTVIAVYSIKGGVGKTTLAVNLAWSAAMLSARRTLLWDLDPQAAASWLVRPDKAPKQAAGLVYEEEVRPSKLIRATATDRLDLLPADSSLRGLDRLFFNLGKKKRLARLIDAVAKDYDRIILDCAPGLTETSEQVMRAADLILVPVIPSALSRRAFDDVVRHIERHHAANTSILPVHSMVDRRRTLHREALAAYPEWPAIPLASAVERASEQRTAVGALAAASPASQAFAGLWRGIERRIADISG